MGPTCCFSAAEKIGEVPPLSRSRRTTTLRCIEAKYRDFAAPYTALANFERMQQVFTDISHIGLRLLKYLLRRQDYYKITHHRQYFAVGVIKLFIQCDCRYLKHCDILSQYVSRVARVVGDILHQINSITFRVHETLRRKNIATREII